ncbi:phosphoribosylformylglycinamidine synthase [Nitrosomonadales bacterium]|nr:phosphoribosylformylglycinamidine synthase [Nitrosomonadales bacterium]
MQKNTITSFFGSRIYSEFRKSTLLNDALKSISGIKNLTSSYLHVIESKEKLSSKVQKSLNQILTYGEDIKEEVSPENAIFIGPRIGTISPWSSRATDIVQQCGIDILRIERIKTISFVSSSGKPLSKRDKEAIGQLLYDRMTESIFIDQDDINKLFIHHNPRPLNHIDIIDKGIYELHDFNETQGLALSDDEIDYLFKYFSSENRNPSDAELMMFAQANSEHCRHKIFNASWIIDGKEQSDSLFSMIRNTHKISPKKTIVAYSDNSSIIEGSVINRFYPDMNDKYLDHSELTHYLMKVETHNHPTAISPFAGAATGSGGEIRDEGATGRGSKPKAGLAGFSVSNLRIPNFTQPWEKNNIGKPDRIASALQIMIDAPIGAAAYNNEFGRPNILGYFRSLEYKLMHTNFGYHKPIMLAGGIGSISDAHTHKEQLKDGNLLIQLGGPAMLIGLGGGAASSMKTGANKENLDFASVQRGNPELQRRAQEVIDRCWQLADKNPILSIHDVGAGGLSNAFPELINDGGMGAIMNIRDINNEELGMSPKEIWSNEAQERYVLAIDEKDLKSFSEICKRERCPFKVVGKTAEGKNLKVEDSLLKQDIVEMDLDVLLGKPPKLIKNIDLISKKHFLSNENWRSHKGHHLDEIKKVLSYPSVSSKNFLITIGDRSVTGLIAQDQMVGPWQVPVSNVGVTKSTFDSITGEAMAIGEKAPIAMIDAAASARMAVCEAITNIAASAIEDISLIKLSANWMAASGSNYQDSELFKAVKAIGMELCPDLGISIPVGKDSMSMETTWRDDEVKTVTSPLSVIITAFSESYNVNKTLTPQLIPDEDTSIILIDLGAGKNRMGGSAYNLVNQIDHFEPPNLDNVGLIKNFFKGIQFLNKENKLLAYHDRSDGGLITAALEMAFAGHCGLKLVLPVERGTDIHGVDKFLFNEELGALIQVHNKDIEFIQEYLGGELGLSLKTIGNPTKAHEISLFFSLDGYTPDFIFKSTRWELQQAWSETSFRIQSIRDNPKSAKQEFNLIFDDSNPGINPKVNFEIPSQINVSKLKPKIAILREQGINGHSEMAAAFNYAGFEAHDVHMSDILTGQKSLKDFNGLAACGGFSFGDVLGAGEGWAKSILFNTKLRDEFQAFFERKDTIALGVCNGCQMMSNIKEIIPGADLWPKFIKNESEQFEARFVMVEITKNNSLFFDEMIGSVLPVVVSHGEGRVKFANEEQLHLSQSSNLISLKYVDNNHRKFSRSGKGTLMYPMNPNGSPDGITGLTSSDGRVSIMMPHPERVFRTDQNSWHPKKWENFGPWYRMFANANNFFT